MNQPMEGGGRGWKHRDSQRTEYKIMCNHDCETSVCWITIHKCYICTHIQYSGKFSRGPIFTVSWLIGKPRKLNPRNKRGHGHRDLHAAWSITSHQFVVVELLQECLCHFKASSDTTIASIICDSCAIFPSISRSFTRFWAGAHIR